MTNDEHQPSETHALILGNDAIAQSTYFEAIAGNDAETVVIDEGDKPDNSSFNHDGENE